MKSILAALIALGASFAQAQIEVFSIGNVAVMYQNTDGSYDVVCKNGNREKVTDLDISLNNVCPNKTSSQPTNILSLQLREDGNFDVVCKDLRKLIATPEQVVSGEACGSAPAKIDLEDGNYKTSQPTLCPQSIKGTRNDKGELVSIYISYLGQCGGGNTYYCKEKVCTTSSQSSSATIINSKSYEFQNISNKGIFVKEN